MKSIAKLFLILPSTLVCHAALADSRAVEETNYQAMLSLGTTSLSQNQNINASINGSITAPLAKYLGATVSGGYSGTNATIESQSCNLDASGASIDAFARDYDIGKIGLGYTRGRGSWCSYSSFSGRENGHTTDQAQAINAAYYLSSWTISTSYAESKTTIVQSDVRKSLTSIGTSFYPMNNLSIGATIKRLSVKDANFSQDTGYLAVEYQPQILGNTTSLLLRISETLDNEQTRATSATLSITYFFGKQVDLITRDRRYR